MKTVKIRSKLATFIMALILVLCYTCTMTTAINVNGEDAENPTTQSQIISNGTETSVTIDGVTYLTQKKTITETGVENEFLITLTVETMSKQETTSPDMAVVLVFDVSNSMENNNIVQNQTTMTRLVAAKAAAKSFIELYSKDAGNAKRYISIVTFGSSARTKILGGTTENPIVWLDVANGDQSKVGTEDVKTTDVNIDTVLDTIDGIAAAETDYLLSGNNPNNRGGTNIEAGLMLAKNVLGISPISLLATTNKFTILLTDGAPTFHVASNATRSSTTHIAGSRGGYSSADYTQDVVPAEAAATEVKKISTLYTIAFASTDATCYTTSTPVFVCELEEHAHDLTNGICMELTCDGISTTHTAHTDACYPCGHAAHTHDDTCITYIDEEHTHDESCHTITCGKEEHTHTDYTGSCYSLNCERWHPFGHYPRCYIMTCTQEAHTHSESCRTYNCGKEVHTHTESCIEYTCGKTIHTHTVTCVCGYEDHTHTDRNGDCYELTCTDTSNRHNHRNNCYTFVCTKHVHSDDCYDCGKVTHTHTGSSGSCYSTTITIGYWLKNNIASTGNAYSADDLTGLNDAFANIGTSIEQTAQAGTVTDPMSEAVTFVGFTDASGNALAEGTATGAVLNEAGTQFVWSLSGVTPTVREDESGATWYTYTLSYKIKLDTTSDAYQNAENYTVPTNGETTLSYTIKDGDEEIQGTTSFDVPTVTGYAGADVYFTKVGPGGSAISGAKFGLFLQDAAEGDPAFIEATATENGVVEFKNVPSGQVYIMKETEAPIGYALNDTEYEVTVSMGNWSVKLDGVAIDLDLGEAGTGFTVVNEYSYVTVTLDKTIIDANGSDISTSHAGMKFFVKISGTTFDGNDYVTWVVVSSNSTEEVMLPQGTYTLTELELTDYDFVRYQIANTATEVNPAADIIVIDSEVTGTVEVEIVNKYEDGGYFHKTGDVENVIPGGAM